jgi:hypothetical protein
MVAAVLTASSAVSSVFYVRGDWPLLTPALIFLIGVA